MRAFAELAELANLPHPTALAARGEVELAGTGREYPPVHYGFPPCFIPLWSDETFITTYGLWMHWLGDRTPTFVRLDSDGDPRTFEIARTGAQLVVSLLLDLVELGDDVSERVRRVGRVLGYTDFVSLERVARSSGSRAVRIAEHPAFAGRLPKLVADEGGHRYDGEFPVGNHPSDLSRHCTLEVTPDVRWKLRVSPDVPVWFREEYDLDRRFYAFLQRGEIEKCWWCLNSSGWTQAAAVEALAALSKRSGNPHLVLLGEIWSRLPEPEFGGY